ncbi:MAG: heparin lyase I family protein [Caldilineaceae bacterium]|nr:heparin lyase I family protein [Caldilineaceae bacterium]
MSRIFQPCLLILPLVMLVLAGCSVNAQDGRRSSNRNADNRNKEATVQPAAKPGIERTPSQGPIVWQADLETGDLSEWRLDMKDSIGTEVDSGKCSRDGTGVTTEQAHSGAHSMKLVINSQKTAGCRQFRKLEPASGQSYYYSAWFFIPEHVQVGVFWNIFQFKSNIKGKSGLFWKLEVRNNEAGDMMIVPVWKGPIPGPHEGDGVDNILYPQTKTIVPVAKWFHLEVFLKQSENFDGQIIVWQDGIELLNMQNVRTKYPGGIQNWSVNNYGNQLTPNPTTLYIDDVAISTQRIGP